MKLRITLIIIFALFVSFMILFTRCKLELKKSNQKVDALHYLYEIELVRKEQYYNMLKYQLNSQFYSSEFNIHIYNNETSEEKLLSDIIQDNDFVLCIPQYSCQDCIKKIVEIISKEKDSINKIIILSFFYDKNEQSGFRKKYKLNDNIWEIYSTESKYYWDLTSNKILLFKNNYENNLINSILIDGEFEELLINFLKLNL